MARTTANAESPVPKMWIYQLAEGWTAYAGKTDEDNDLLSLSFAQGNDYWLHVHAMPGSHVILRGPENITPSRELLEQAAAIAGWHSKARHGGNCQIDYTQAKYVNKPQGVPAGTVTISHSRRLKVKPSLGLNSPSNDA